MYAFTKKFLNRYKKKGNLIIETFFVFCSIIDIVYMKKGVLHLKKLMLVFMLLFAFLLPGFAEAKSFSGHSSFSSSHSTTSTRTYHSGYKSPSSNVSRTPSSYNSPNSYSRSSRSGSFWSHAAAFGAGAFFGHMFHPFGGHYYGSSYGFSFIGLLVDILVIYIIYRIIRRIFRRRY